MAITAVGKPPSSETGPTIGNITKGIADAGSYAHALNVKCGSNTNPTSYNLKQIAYLHGEPRIIWEEEKINQMIIKEELQYAVVGKVSYGWPEIQDLRRLIPNQCGLKGEVNRALLSSRYIFNKGVKIGRLYEFAFKALILHHSKLLVVLYSKIGSFI